MGAAGDLGLWASRQDPHSGIFGNQLIRKWALLLPARNRASSSISSVDHTCPLVGKVVSHHYLTGMCADLRRPFFILEDLSERYDRIGFFVNHTTRQVELWKK